MSETGTAKLNDWVLDAFADSIFFHEADPIDVWAEKNVMLPTNTSEPGRYSADRCPYQREILQVMSPESPVNHVTLCWGSQNGKTTCENNIMFYYMDEYPAPMAFGFSDDNNLKEYIKKKFDPSLEANPQIKNRLRAAGGSKSSGNTLTSKIFPGGFIKFLSGKSEASLRSDSVMIFIGDELDAWGITKGGDPIALAEQRTNTFGSRAKICLSSTPLNESIIYNDLEKSTNKHFMVPCPCCNELMEFDMDNFRWAEENGRVIKAWMECPHCHNMIFNEDKVDLLPKGKWVATNPNADPQHQGYYLPTFYAPVGWKSFKKIASEYYNARYGNNGSVDYNLMTTFYNTVLAKPYIVGSESQDWRILSEKSLDSPYQRGKIPSWVNILTTGSDVQGNRIETTLMGWGFRGRHIPIDHYVFYIEQDQNMEMLDNPAWTKYVQLILNGTWFREDGLEMTALANAIDRSYKSTVISEFYITLSAEERERCFPVRGYERMTGFIPTLKYDKREGLRDARYWDVPVNPLKRQVYDHLALKDNDEGTVAFMPIYPADYDQEFYMQLFSETEVLENKKLIWKKNRDRNEILDTHVYNYAMFYQLGLGTFKDEDWLALAEAQREQLENPQRVMLQQRRGVLNRGISL